MSVSRKLETLLKRHASERTWAKAQMELYAALPQIIAVVEAAEDAANEFTHKWLINALEDLEEALDGGKIRDSKLTDRFDWNSRDGVTFDAGQDEA